MPDICSDGVCVTNFESVGRSFKLMKIQSFPSSFLKILVELQQSSVLQVSILSKVGSEPADFLNKQSIYFGDNPLSILSSDTVPR